MIVQEKQMVEKVLNRYYCDICKEESDWVFTCKGCKKHICENCIEQELHQVSILDCQYDRALAFYGSAKTVLFCKDCSSKLPADHKSYALEVNNLIDSFNNQLSEIHKRIGLENEED